MVGYGKSIGCTATFGMLCLYGNFYRLLKCELTRILINFDVL